MNIWQTITEHVISPDAGPGLFNPYRDRHEEWDRPDAPVTRIRNLKAYVETGRSRIDFLLIAEAPGPWGCRFSGVPITSEAQLVDPNFPGTGVRTTVRDEPFSEYSASIYWDVLAPHFHRIFTWNTVPFHPFHNGRPDSIRTPRQSEINAFLPVLEAVVRWSEAGQVLAVGRKAENALKRIGVDATYVRHPSQGGAVIFRESVNALLDQTTPATRTR